MSTATLTPSLPTAIRLAQPKRWTVAEFHAICGEPAFENKKLILVDGEILEIPNPNPPHDTSLLLTQALLQIVFGTGFCVRGQMALVLGLSTDPMPDLAVVKGSPRDYSTVQPRTAELVVEIADSSLTYDTRDKANLYAAGGVPEYWVVDLVNRQLHIFRDPMIDAVQLFGAYYRSRQSLDASATINALAAPANPITVSNLLP